MSYRIEDEPQPSAWAKWVFDPLWPLFAIMFGGAAYSWTWFVINGFAVGSPTRRRELGLVLAGAVTSWVLLLLIAVCFKAKILNELGIRYALLAVTVLKLGVSYWLYTLQARSFHLYAYFGGAVRNGFFLALGGGYLFQRIFLARLPEFWVALLR